MLSQAVRSIKSASLSRTKYSSEIVYTLETSLISVTGIGPMLAAKLESYAVTTVLDFLLWLPIRYEDRSHLVTIEQLEVNQLVTLKAQVLNSKNFYKGRRSIQSATVADETGTLKLMWFNNHFIIEKLKPENWYLISGKLGERGVMVQATVEDVKEDTIHTNRLVPIYAKLSTIKQGTLRRLLKHILDNVTIPANSLTSFFTPPLELSQVFEQLHFPDTEELVVSARERLAVEELMSVIAHSRQLKAHWLATQSTYPITIQSSSLHPLIPSSVPFSLTTAQQQAVSEILEDLQAPHPMNRLLLGDVGSGKTVVAGLAIRQTIANGFHAALVAPTQILAEQHAQTLHTLFPDIQLQLVTSKTKKLRKKVSATKASTEAVGTDTAPADAVGTNDTHATPQPTLFVGTHALLNKLETIQPALIIYDEQHRFGVVQRSFSNDSGKQPNTLTMSATPIPRSLMLTLFEHLGVSYLNEMPPGRLPVTTWLVPETKRESSLDWMGEQVVAKKSQAFIVCPFISPSESEAFGHVANVTDTFVTVTAYFSRHFPQLKIGLLHGKLKATEKAAVTEQLFAGEIDILVTTPVIEVGLDVPAASIIVIENAERFGLASLHQLRGRVGRAGQEAFCLLFSPSKAQTRLKQFSQEHNGLKLSELDLQRRGAGDLFGTEQSGLDTLRFANWTNLELIGQARMLFDRIEKEHLIWKPVLNVSDQLSEVQAN